MNESNSDSAIVVSPSYFCVVTGDTVECVELKTRDELVRHLRERHQTALESADPDIRVFVFSGARLILTGTENRQIVFPDGTSEPITNNPVEPTDHLLSAAERTRLGRF